MAELILKVTDSRLEIQFEPAGQTFVTNRIGDTRLAEEDLGFKNEMELEEGLKKLITWRDANKELVARRRTKAPIKT